MSLQELLLLVTKSQLSFSFALTQFDEDGYPVEEGFDDEDEEDEDEYDMYEDEEDDEDEWEE